jgi:hypothetical protein
MDHLMLMTTLLNTVIFICLASVFAVIAIA